MELYYSVADEVFSRFPGYVRGVVLAYDVRNGASPPELIGLLREAESSIRRRLRLEELASHPRIASWREAYRSFGANPGKFRSSVEAMIRRVLRDQEVPSINSLVDMGNLISLRHLLPAGAHAIDVVTEDIRLRPATGKEDFVPFGSGETEHPEPGEIIFAEGNTVLTRRWSWRQANHTLTGLTTTDVELNVDGLPPVSPADVRTASQELAGLIGRFCGGEIRQEVLSEENPRIRLKG